MPVINNNAENNFEGEDFFLPPIGVSNETQSQEELDIFLPSLVRDRVSSLVRDTSSSLVRDRVSSMISNISCSYSSSTDLDLSMSPLSSNNLTFTPNRWTTPRSLNNNNDTIFFGSNFSQNSIDSISSQFYCGSYADTVCLDNVRTVPERTATITRPRRNAISHISAAELSQLFN